MAKSAAMSTVKKRTWWELRSRKRGKKWHVAGTTVQRTEVDAFLRRGESEGFEVQAWRVVERTEIVKMLSQML